MELIATVEAASMEATRVQEPFISSSETTKKRKEIIKQTYAGDAVC